MGRLLLGVWGKKAIKIPNCIALEYVKSIFEGMGIRGRFLYAVVDLSLTVSPRIDPRHRYLLQLTCYETFTLSCFISSCHYFKLSFTCLCLCV